MAELENGTLCYYHFQIIIPPSSLQNLDEHCCLHTLVPQQGPQPQANLEDPNSLSVSLDKPCKPRADDNVRATCNI